MKESEDKKLGARMEENEYADSVIQLHYWLLTQLSTNSHLQLHPFQTNDSENNNDHNDS